MYGPDSPQRPPARGVSTADAGVALLATLAALLGLWVGASPSAGPLFRADAFAVAVALGQGLPLLARRHRPVLVFAVVTGVAFLHAAAGHPNAGSYLGPVFATYALAAYAPTTPALAGFAWLVVGFTATRGWVAVGAGRGAASRTSELLTSTLVAGIVWGLGRYVRVRRAYVAALVARAERAETDRAEATRRALQAERARIARELHDVVAHHVGVMVLQAGGARGVLATDPGRARAALQQIEHSGRQALLAMPVLLDALRNGDGETPRGPTPRLDDLPALLRSVDAAGLRTTLDVTGVERPLSDGMALAVYRIVQESLTNVLRHARATRADVRLAYASDGVTVEVTDDGTGTTTPAAGESAGYGLAGMRERVALLGGRLEAGPRREPPAGRGGTEGDLAPGWAVRAWLPRERGA